MKFIDLTTKYNISQDKFKTAIATVSIILVSIISVIGVKAVLNTQAEAERQRRIDEANRLLENAVTIETTDETSVRTPSEDDLIIREGDDIPRPTVETSETETTDETSDETDETTSETEETTTEQTTTALSETPVYMTVYATMSVNLRTGPGTEYDLVRTLEAGDAIDVIAETSTGWYKTINGNYVHSSYTSTVPLNTPTPVPAPTSQATAATTVTTTVATVVQTAAGSGSTYSCTITFYGPQLLSDGSYSTTTATGTACTEGRTCAADWNIFPAGTVIYIENDPLGGDGYYTVEDRGPGVTGYHIDIYADDPYSHSTGTRNVTVS